MESEAEHGTAGGSDGSPIPRVAPGDTNPASDLKTDIIKDVEREHEITGDFVGPRSDDMADDDES